MKLDFKDRLQQDAIDLTFSVNFEDDIERDFYPNHLDVRWSIAFTLDHTGVLGFKYELEHLHMPVTIEAVDSEGNVEKTNINVEVKYSQSKKDNGYVCRIYEDVIVDGKYDEDEYAIFPIKIAVEESPSDDEGNRAQIFMKYVELDLSSDKRSLILTI
jgi:hypothetical protein